MHNKHAFSITQRVVCYFLSLLSYSMGAIAVFRPDLQDWAICKIWLLIAVCSLVWLSIRSPRRLTFQQLVGGLLIAGFGYLVGYMTHNPHKLVELYLPFWLWAVGLPVTMFVPVFPLIARRLGRYTWQLLTWPLRRLRRGKPAALARNPAE